MLEICKYCVGLLSIFERLSNFWIVPIFSKDRVYYSLANLWIDSMRCFLGSLGVFFSNNVEIEVTIDPLLDDFWSDSIVLIFFSSLSGCGEISSRSVAYIPDLFFLKYSLIKVSLLKSIFKAMELLSLAFAVVIIVSHLNNLKRRYKI